MCPTPKSKADGFTLTELLVVICILGLLMAILLPTLGSVMNRGRKTACLSELQQFKTALELYERDNRDYPPSTLAELGIKADNGINSGVESLVLCLSSTIYGTAYYSFADDRLDNSDQDSSSVSLKKLTGSCFEVNSLWELTDPWNNPYVFFHHRDLAQPAKKTYIIQDSRVEVLPDSTKTKTGRVRGHSRYQITSCGGDMTFGTSDDVKSD